MIIVTQKFLAIIFLVNLLSACSYSDNPVAAILALVAQSNDNLFSAGIEKMPDKISHFKQVPLEQIEIIVQESFPIQVTVIAKGELPNDCISIDQVTQVRKDNLFTIELLMQEHSNQICTMLKKPYETIVSLDIEGFQAGIYTVKVNEISKIFELNVDNGEL
jgi:inhibitor of cysteine peptidase